ncbi:hypothetical protein [Enterococcus mundtii]|uniref:hypothetical protein n=1 Tax=Enterococcus mundtii TaxID=53346 RepID=UPI00129C2946|nr:hypothetical protein [Enterococcus mundtii]
MKKFKFLTLLLTVITLASFIVPSMTSIAKASEIKNTNELSKTKESIMQEIKKMGVDLTSLTDEQNTLVDKMVETSQNTFEVSQIEKENVTNYFSKDLANNKVQLHIDNTYLDKAKIVVVQTIDKITNEEYYVITLPVASEDYSFISNVTATYSSNGELKALQETLITKSQKNTFEIHSYSNNNLVNHEILDDTFVSNEQIKNDIQNVTNEVLENSKKRGAVQIIACLVVVLGVSYYLAGVILAACSALCIATLGAACAACIGGFCAFAGVSLTTIGGCFKL